MRIGVSSTPKRRRLTNFDLMELEKSKAKITAAAEKLGREIRVFETSLSSATSQTSSNEEEPDDFYEFTAQDYYRVLSTKKEDNFLKTRKIREAEESSRRSRITKTIIRIRFPDNYTLEAKFHSSETFQNLIDLLTKVVARPEIPFYIYTTPPKKQIKDMSQAFYSAGFIPGAIVYFSYDLPKAMIPFTGLGVTSLGAWVTTLGLVFDDIVAILLIPATPSPLGCVVSFVPRASDPSSSIESPLVSASLGFRDPLNSSNFGSFGIVENVVVLRFVWFVLLWPRLPWPEAMMRQSEIQLEQYSISALINMVILLPLRFLKTAIPNLTITIGESILIIKAHNDLVKQMRDDSESVNSVPYLQDEILSLIGLDVIPEQAEIMQSLPETVAVGPSLDVAEVKTVEKKSAKPKWFKGR
ncbi:hypothetical protein GIB67_000430 [Kingdonia uniflora]|uniref:UBX domain-containing protein n=1 Tax=Kingdonia uniflora TaxID=39325 RepID=A0A7J7MQ17_9MAGN|nr:hypothetical protein GIB67_000430 [Kingdonia uniflora]